MQRYELFFTFTIIYSMPIKSLAVFMVFGVVMLLFTSALRGWTKEKGLVSVETKPFKHFN